MNVAVAEESKVITIGEITIPLSEMPDAENITAVLAYADAVESQYSDERGRKTFVNFARTYATHVNLANVHWKRLSIAHQTLNGFRTKRNHQGQTLRGKRTVARRFFETLSNTIIRDYCDALNVDYEAYNTVDDRYAAMAQAQHPDQP